LEALAGRQPLLIILEDVHWLDNESTFLLEKLVKSSRIPLVLVLTGREPLELEGFHFMRLLGLSDEVIAQVAQRVFGADALDPSLAAWVCNQASGNPLYAQELCQAVQYNDATFLDRETGEVRWTRQAPTLPLSLHELMLARLDELPLPQQEILKRAAVIGLSFDEPLLRMLYNQSFGESDFEAGLERIVRTGLLVETQSKIYRFNHPLMQEAIYATLSFSQRQVWHIQVANWLIEHHLDQSLQLITYHCLSGNDEPKAAYYSRRAGDKAREQEAYAGALTYYEQVLQLQEVPLVEKQLAAESRGDVLMLLREYTRAETAYAQAAKLGSTAALVKGAIVSRKFEQLARLELVTPMLQAWAKASQAYILAQNHQYQPALELAYLALVMAPASTKPAIQGLVQAVETQQHLESYELWLQQFTEVALRESSEASASFVSA
jgi:predicted ATPase